ncbi:MAG TPA: NAD(P)-dependent oxidoreductase [Anaerolineae bacterium]|nr:NAD(P)-dependent oxidoreductase [Anaerolineae bacterium]
MIGAMRRMLAGRDQPIDIVLVGLGFMGYGFLQRVMKTPGLRVPVVISRGSERTVAFLRDRGIGAVVARDVRSIQENVNRGLVSVCADYRVLGSTPCRIVVEVTGEVEYGTEVALQALGTGKHLVTMNAALHATVGSQLLRYAQKHGVLMTDAEGDQPGSIAALIEEAAFLGFTPVMAGNMKRFLYRYATPASMKEEAAKRGISLPQITAFTDGTKIALEMTLVANYLGMSCLTRGMHGYHADSIEDVLTLFDWAQAPTNGFVDYIIGMGLFPGVFAVCEHEDPEQASYLKYLGIGEGPRYILYRPYHLCHFEAVVSVARVALFGEATIHNSLHPTTETIAIAKRDLRVGEVLDGIGAYCCYGMIEDRTIAHRHDLLPIGLSGGAVVRRRIGKDEAIRLADVDLPDQAATRVWRDPAFLRNCSTTTDLRVR